jgi:hypothetical protein
VGSGALTYDFSSGITSINNLAISSLNFDTNAGIVSWADLPLDTNASAGTVESYTANVGGQGVLTVYGEADGSGNAQNLRVGIGTTSPETTLTVVGSICAARAAGTQTAACGSTPGAIYANSSSLSAGVDVAEMYPTNDASLAAGDIVSFDPQNPVYVERASGQSNFLGIVSTKPALTLGDTSSSTRAIALAGRVPVKVNLEGGPINVGDAITLSSAPGVGARATTTAQTVGIALGSWAGSGTTTTGTVDVFIKPELTFAGMTLDALAALSDFGSTTEPDVPQGSFMDTFLHNVLAAVGAWLADATNGITKIFAKEVHTDELCVKKSDGSDVCVTGDQLAALLGSSGGSAASSTQDDSTSSPQDTQPPAVSINGNNPATVLVGALYSDLGASVSDNVNDNLGYYVSVDNGATTTQDQLVIDTSAAGEHTIVYSATDQAGNTGSATRVVRVIDPVAALAPAQDATSTATSTQQ